MMFTRALLNCVTNNEPQTSNRTSRAVLNLDISLYFRTWHSKHSHFSSFTTTSIN